MSTQQHEFCIQAQTDKWEILHTVANNKIDLGLTVGILTIMPLFILTKISKYHRWVFRLCLHTEGLVLNCPIEHPIFGPFHLTGEESSLLHFAISRGPHTSVWYITVNIRYLPHWKMMLGMVCDVNCCIILLGRGTCSLVTGQVFKNAIRMCYI